MTRRTSDGTEQNATVLVIVGAGGGEAFWLSGFVIPANLTVGDTVYITGYSNVTLAGETTRAYAGARESSLRKLFTVWNTTNLLLGQTNQGNGRSIHNL